MASMQTYFVGSDKYIRRTESLTIVEKSNMIDKIHFLVPSMLNDEYDMTSFDCVMECHFPVTKNVKLITLNRSETLYDNAYVEYTLPTNAVTTTLTQEPGSVEFILHFMQVYLDVDGTKIEQSWSSANHGILKVIPLANWFSPTDAGLSDIAQLYLSNKASIEALQALANSISDTKADGIVADPDRQSLYLTSGGTKSSDEIPFEILESYLVDAGGASKNSGNVSIRTI